MGETESIRVRASTSPKERLFREKRFRTGVRITKFGRAVEALWPDKPALNLAQRMGVSERNALQIIRGERRVTARAVHVINTEILD